MPTSNISMATGNSSNLNHNFNINDEKLKKSKFIISDSSEEEDKNNK
jgi:hypothetical protein